MSVAQPLVSVIMPAYNAGDYIVASIDSVLAQSYTNWELIIINDGSSDDTAEIIEHYRAKDERILCITHSSNQGLIATRNRGLEEAKGNYIANLDSDDIALSNRLTEQVRFMELHAEIILLGSACELIDGASAKQGLVHRELPDEHLETILLFSNYFINSTVMFRAKEVRTKAYDIEFPLAEDYALFVKLRKLGKLANLNKVLVQYRVHGDNISLIKEGAMTEAIMHIQGIQLKALGLRPDEKEIQMHHSLVDGKAISLGYSLPEVESWCLALIAANKQKAIYNQSVMEHYCAFFYRRACESSGMGAGAIRQFRKSALSSFIRKDIKGNIAFLIKSLTR